MGEVAFASSVTESENCHKLADRDNYTTVKEHLLKEFKLTPREYRSKFMDAKKTAEETYMMFTAQLKNLLNYYVKSRQVNVTLMKTLGQIK